MELTGQTLAGKYRLDELLQTSGIAQLYRATHTLMEKRMMIKVLNPILAQDPQIVEKFESEAKIASRLAHPNILNVTDYGTDPEGAVFLVMENQEGETLTKVIRREGIILLSRAIEIMRQIAAALSVAHKAGISHLDLQPDNILLTQTGEGQDWVKVFNFSVAPVGENPAVAGDSLTSEVGGNPLYLSPEQCFHGDAGQSSDIYSLAVIFYEMITGKTPFNGANAQEIMLQQVETPPPALSEVRPDLPFDIENVLSRALSKKPTHRFQNVADFTEALTRAAGGNEEETLVRPREMSAVAGAAGVDPLVAANAENGNNMWKTAFIVTLGIAVLSAVMFYLTWGRKTDLATVPSADANANPVQPINPATGTSEQNLTFNNPNANMANGAPMPVDPYGGMPNVPNGIPPGVPTGKVPENGQTYNYPPPTGYTGIPPGVPNAPIVTTNCGSEFMPCDTTVQQVPNPNYKPTPNPANINSNINTNSNKSKNTNSTAKPVNGANTSAPTTANPPKNANVAVPNPANPPTGTNPPATNPETKPTTTKVPKSAPKPSPKQAEKPKTGKPQESPASTGKQLDS